MPSIGDNLKALRNIRGLSQNDVAEALKVTRQTISSYETGRTEPDLETLKGLAELYNVDLHDVLYGESRMQGKINFIRRTACVISVVLLLALLLRSAIFLVNNKFYVVRDGTSITSENRQLIAKRFAQINVAENIAKVGVAVFSIGCLLLLYPLIAISKESSPKKLLAWLVGLIPAMFAVTIPFMLNDDLYGKWDYLLPLLRVLPPIILLLLVITITFAVRKLRRKGTRERSSS